MTPVQHPLDVTYPSHSTEAGQIRREGSRPPKGPHYGQTVTPGRPYSCLVMRRVTRGNLRRLRSHSTLVARSGFRHDPPVTPRTLQMEVRETESDLSDKARHDVAFPRSGPHLGLGRVPAQTQVSLATGVTPFCRLNRCVCAISKYLVIISCLVF